jgi:hypothetical protein
MKRSPHTCRSVCLPHAIGNVSPRGDVAYASLATQQRIADKGPHLVLVCPSGDVYVVPHNELRAEILADQFAAWLAGTFTSAISAEDLADDMVTTYAALQPVKRRRAA